MALAFFIALSLFSLSNKDFFIISENKKWNGKEGGN